MLYVCGNKGGAHVKWFLGKGRSSTYQSTDVLYYCPRHPKVVMFRDIRKVQKLNPRTPEEERACYTCGLCYQEEHERSTAFHHVYRSLPRNLHLDYHPGEVVRHHNRQLLPLYNLERFPTTILDDELGEESSS
jgi:hypothetical protein